MSSSDPEQPSSQPQTPSAPSPPPPTPSQRPSTAHASSPHRPLPPSTTTFVLPISPRLTDDPIRPYSAHAAANHLSHSRSHSQIGYPPISYAYPAHAAIAHAYGPYSTSASARTSFTRVEDSVGPYPLLGAGGRESVYGGEEYAEGEGVGEGEGGEGYVDRREREEEIGTGLPDPPLGAHSLSPSPSPQPQIAITTTQAQVQTQTQVAPTSPIPQTPSTFLTFLLLSGRRRSMSFEPETTVGRVKELVWSGWGAADWQEERPPAPSYLRVVYLGKILQDEDTLKDLNFPIYTPPTTSSPLSSTLSQQPTSPTSPSRTNNPATPTPTPTIVHLSIRPYAPPSDDGLKKKRKRLSARIVGLGLGLGVGVGVGGGGGGQNAGESENAVEEEEGGTNTRARTRGIGSMRRRGTATGATRERSIGEEDEGEGHGRGVGCCSCVIC